MAIKTIFGDFFFRITCLKIMTQLDFFLGILQRYELNIVVTLTNVELRKNTLPVTTIWEMIECFGVLI